MKLLICPYDTVFFLYKENLFQIIPNPQNLVPCSLFRICQILAKATT